MERIQYSDVVLGHEQQVTPKLFECSVLTQPRNLYDRENYNKADEANGDSDGGSSSECDYRRQQPRRSCQSVYSYYRFSESPSVTEPYSPNDHGSTGHQPSKPASPDTYER
uniref:Uncharacterized protein n=1 Tax=Bionectria ochroleuca TaxID=29856 RepID=A0A8H7N135_BIOOC